MSPEDLWILGPNIGMVGTVFSKLTALSLRRLAFIPRITTFTRVECQGPSQFFKYSDRIKFRPDSSLIDPTSKTMLMMAIFLQ